jgi:UDP-glucose 4-epimerase
VEVGQSNLTNSLHGEDYNSQNTKQLDVPTMKGLLLTLDLIQRTLRGQTTDLEG